MWVAEFRVWHEGSYALEQTKRFNVKVYIMHLNPHLKHGKLAVNRAIVVTGPDADKYIAVLKNEKRLRIKHVEGNQIFYEINPRASYHTAIISPDLFIVRPISIERGQELWVIASWSKKKLLDFFEKVKCSKIKTEIKLLSMRQENVKLFSAPSLQGLTERQQSAFLLALQNGYYGYPRQINLQQLAKLFGTNVSSYRENLRRAEQKALSTLAHSLF